MVNILELQIFKAFKLVSHYGIVHMTVKIIIVGQTAEKHREQEMKGQKGKYQEYKKDSEIPVYCHKSLKSKNIL